MDLPKIAVIIPVFNGARYLADAIGSLRAQTFSSLQIVVVDDGSSDQSADIAASFPGVNCIRQTHQGVAAARNRGIAGSPIASLLAFHDADDICLPERFERQFEQLSANPQLRFSLCRLQNFIQPDVVVPVELITPELMKPRKGFISSGLFHRDVFDQVGGFDVSLRSGEDVDWLIRAQELGVLHDEVDQVLIRRRLHDRNLSAQIKLGHDGLLKAIRASLSRRSVASIE